MQKIVLIILGVGAIGAGLWYMAQGTQTQELATQQDAAESDIEKSEEKLNGLGSFVSLLAFGSKIECSFDSATEGYVSEGKFYTDGEHFRVEATSEVPEQGTQISNIINDGSYTYVWGSNNGIEMALKMKNTEPVAGEVHDGATMSESGFDLEENVNYECRRWSVDAEMFVPPVGVTFMYTETMMQDAMQGMPEGFELPEGVELPEGFEI